MKFTASKKIILVALILVIIFAISGNNNIHRCTGDSFCFGIVTSSIQGNVWLDVKDSVLKIKSEEIKSCIGYEMQISMIFDGCPGSWGWFNERPVNCQDVLSRCSNSSSLVSGIRCSEWERACEEIKTKNTVPITIENINETGVRKIG